MRYILSSFLIMVTINAVAQDWNKTYPSFGLCLGSNFYNSKTIELGIGFQTSTVMSKGTQNPFGGFSVAYELPYVDKKPTVISANWFIMGGIAMGLNINRSSLDGNNTYGLKPMIGIAIRRVAIMWGYNFFLNKNEIPNLKHNEWTLRTYIQLFGKKE